jgi:hypothetical protein
LSYRRRGSGGTDHTFFAVILTAVGISVVTAVPMPFLMFVWGAVRSRVAWLLSDGLGALDLGLDLAFAFGFGLGDRCGDRCSAA